jgi:hypothetical protein
MKYTIHTQAHTELCNALVQFITLDSNSEMWPSSQWFVNFFMHLRVSRFERFIIMVCSAVLKVHKARSAVRKVHKAFFSFKSPALSRTFNKVTLSFVEASNHVTPGKNRSSCGEEDTTRGRVRILNHPWTGTYFEPPVDGYVF